MHVRLRDCLELVLLQLIPTQSAQPPEPLWRALRKSEDQQEIYFWPRVIFRAFFTTIRFSVTTVSLILELWKILCGLLEDNFEDEELEAIVDPVTLGSIALNVCDFAVKFQSVMPLLSRCGADIFSIDSSTHALARS